ncbi:hypothetical protein QE152_g10676 [Popillia japonica]|uniref:Myb/SANT-like DNA-binding domain-containing protein n=1 Tax=Popillia japonica TaxID=7064 RepID=A0AAW1LUE9_POPJA
METFKLSILDPENGIKYDLILNKEDYERANHDEQFVSDLLHHSRNSNENEEALLTDIDCVDNEKGTKTNYRWKYEQVIELIKSMGSHMSDLSHPKTRKQVFEHVANDMISKCFKVSRKQVFEHVANDMISKCFKVSSIMVQNKWNSFLKSYRKAKNNVLTLVEHQHALIFLNLWMR